MIDRFLDDAMDKTLMPNQQIKRQVVLPFFKSVKIALNTIQARRLRSLITTTTLVLAIAFFSFTQISIDIANDVFSSGDATLVQTLQRLGYDFNETQDRESGAKEIESSAKQKWIVMLSLLVCVVGIVNAQLMAVTERFREIGTMKCLGALDHFIVRLFLIEALIQGLAGSLSGAILGTLAATSISFFHYGISILPHLTIKTMGFTMAGSVAVGSLLSLIGVIYPVFVAARMQPVDAMRVNN